MKNDIHISGPIAFMPASGSAVYFSKTNGGHYSVQNGTALIIKKIQNALNVAPWGEDNRFPQNVEQQMAYCGIGKFALNWKANAMYGSGIMPGKVIGFDSNGKIEIFEPLDREGYKEVYDFINQQSMFRFWLEYFQDWCWFGNCFPEAILTNDCKKISHWVHQESCDARFKQMDENGNISTVYLSKIWGASADQFSKFDPAKKMAGLSENPKIITEVDGKLVKTIDAIDMYDALNSFRAIADNLKKKSGLKSAIYPTNFPSVNKTYYQVPAWDGARLGGWVELACKIPQILKLFLKKGTRIQNHIEIPETYFERKFGIKEWRGMDVKKQNDQRRNLLKEMDDFLTSDNAPFSTFVSFFDIDNHTKDETGRIKISKIESQYNIDKEILTTSAANIEILTAMGLHPTLIGTGTIGTGKQATGGSDQREAYLIYTSLLKLERRVALEPLYLTRDFNGWDHDIEFRIIDTQLTTLDKNSGTQKVIS